MVASGLLILDADAYRTSFTGSFDGIFDGKTIVSEGNFRLNNISNDYSMIGEIETTSIDPLNPHCKKLSGYIILNQNQTDINLDFSAKLCEYGLLSYVIGTFDVIDSTGNFDIESGEGRINFITDYHNNNMFGNLQGSVRLQ